MSKVCPHSKRSLERWVAVYKRGGEKALEPKATIPKTSPEETPIWIKERVITKRKKTKLCALKLHWRLAKEGLVVPVRTIGKILKSEGLVRKYRTKRVKYKYLRYKGSPVVEIDVKLCRDWLQTGGSVCLDQQAGGGTNKNDDQSTYHGNVQGLMAVSPRMGKWQYSMAKTIKEERLRWVKPIAEKRVKLVNVSKVCPHSKRSLERWVAVYKRGGEKALEPKATIPKTSPEETPIWIKERVITKRKKTKLCALKLHWRLAKEGLVVPVRTIGKILKSEGLVRKYRRKG